MMTTQLNIKNRVYKVLYVNIKTNEVNYVIVEAANAYLAGQSVLENLGSQYDLLRSQLAKPSELN